MGRITRTTRRAGEGAQERGSGPRRVLCGVQAVRRKSRCEMSGLQVGTGASLAERQAGSVSCGFVSMENCTGASREPSESKCIRHGAVSSRFLPPVGKGVGRLSLMTLYTWPDCWPVTARMSVCPLDSFPLLCFNITVLFHMHSGQHCLQDSV